MTPPVPARHGVPVFARFAGLLVALVAPSAAEAARRSIAPSAAPVEWVTYAETVTATIAGWLSEAGDPATRLRAYLDAARQPGDQSGAPLIVKLWIARNGRVTRIEFNLFADQAANADLRAAIIGRILVPPPRKMLLPLRLSIRIGHATK